MAVDKNLFIYDLAIVAIAKNEAPYIKEWLDYHLLAGVEHFYIYDNDSTDNQKEILQPYIDAGIVTYIFYPGKARQYEAYNDAVLNYRFFCRYMAFIDCDEFIFPQSDKSIVEVVDEILSDKPNAAGVAINWHQFGSNNLETADYSVGVLERFTRRASDSNIQINPQNNQPADNALVKIIANPRAIDYFWNPHFVVYFFGSYAINEKGEEVPTHFNNPPTVEKIVMNHYPTKSREEYEKKVARGVADSAYNIYQNHPFVHTYNDEFDDGILKYRELRLKKFFPKSETFSLENFPKRTESEMAGIIFNSLCENLLSFDPQDLQKNELSGKMETFLTCLTVSEKFHFKFNERFSSQYALLWIHQTLYQQSSAAELLLLFSCLPEILKLNHHLKEKIREGCIEILPKVVEFMRESLLNDKPYYKWQKISDLKYLLEILKIFGSMQKK